MTKKRARPLSPRLLKDLVCNRVIVGHNPRRCETCHGAGVLFHVLAKQIECPACGGMAVEWNGNGK